MDAENVKLIVTIITAIVSVLSLLGVGTAMTLFWKDKHDKKRREIDENSELREQKRLNELRKLMQEELSPIKEEMSEIKADIGKLKRGVQATCRYNLDEIYAKAEEQKFCSTEDKEKFESEYQAYHDLGKNGVMDAKRDRLLALPDRSTKKKKVITD